MLKRVQHDEKKYVIPNLFRNLEFVNDNELLSFAKVMKLLFGAVPLGRGGLSLPKSGRLKSPLPLRRR
jgi:hypothetical protein